MIKNTSAFEEKISHYIQLQKKKDRKSLPFWFGASIVLPILIIVDKLFQISNDSFWLTLTAFGLGTLLTLFIAFGTLNTSNPDRPPEKDFTYIFLTQQNSEIIGARETLRVWDYNKIRIFELPWEMSIASPESRKTFLAAYTNRKPAQSTFEVWSVKPGGRINITIPGEEGPIFAKLLESKAPNLKHVGFTPKS